MHMALATVSVGSACNTMQLGCVELFEYITIVYGYKVGHGLSQNYMTIAWHPHTVILLSTYIAIGI